VLVVLGALGFVVVFSVLAGTFGYPDVLDRPAAEVLPALIAGGASLKAWWITYAILPLFISAAALLAHRHLHARPSASMAPGQPGSARPSAGIITATGVGAGLAMALGLVRWSTLQWSLGESWLADASARTAIEAVSDAANRMLGNGFGEVVGETLLGLWLVGVARLAHVRVVRYGTLVVGALMIVGAWRFAVPALEAVTEATNLALPVGLVALGLTWTAMHRPRVAALATAVATALALVTGAPSSRAADPEPATREVILHGFRAPSMGVELREDWIGFHVGVYPTILDKGADGKGRTTWFAKTGVTFYPFQLDLGSGRPSGLYVGIALMQGLGNAWDASKSATSGAGGFFDLGFRWAAFKGFDLRLGAGALVGFDGRTAFNFTPGFSWGIPF
jgi:hypothetical protein